MKNISLINKYLTQMFSFEKDNAWRNSENYILMTFSMLIKFRKLRWVGIVARVLYF